MARLILIIFAATVLPCLAPAKRAAPEKVAPVIYEGVRYVAPNDDGRHGYIEAWDVPTNKKLWELTVFTNPIDPELEEDVQWVFICGLGDRCPCDFHKDDLRFPKVRKISGDVGGAGR